MNCEECKELVPDIIEPEELMRTTKVLVGVVLSLEYDSSITK